MKYQQKIACHFLDIKIMQLYLKNQKKKQSATPKKCLTNRLKQWEMGKQWSQETLCLRGSKIQRNLHHISLLNIFLIYKFEVIWVGLAVSNQAKLSFYSHTRNELHATTHIWNCNLRNPAIWWVEINLGKAQNLKLKTLVWDRKLIIPILSFDTVFRKIKWQNKRTKCSISGLSLPKYEKKWVFFKDVSLY